MNSISTGNILKIYLLIFLFCNSTCVISQVRQRHTAPWGQLGSEKRGWDFYNKNVKRKRLNIQSLTSKHVIWGFLQHGRFWKPGFERRKEFSLWLMFPLNWTSKKISWTQVWAVQLPQNHKNGMASFPLEHKACHVRWKDLQEVNILKASPSLTHSECSIIIYLNQKNSEARAQLGGFPTPVPLAF